MESPRLEATAQETSQCGNDILNMGFHGARKPYLWKRHPGQTGTTARGASFCKIGTLNKWCDEEWYFFVNKKNCLEPAQRGKWFHRMRSMEQDQTLLLRIAVSWWHVTWELATSTFSAGAMVHVLKTLWCEWLSPDAALKKHAVLTLAFRYGLTNHCTATRDLSFALFTSKRMGSEMMTKGAHRYDVMWRYKSIPSHNSRVPIISSMYMRRDSTWLREDTFWLCMPWKAPDCE